VQRLPAVPEPGAAFVRSRASTPCGTLRVVTDPARHVTEAPRPRVGVGVIVARDGRVLLGLRQGSHGAGAWALPGGHLEWQESFADCAARELAEEAGLTLDRAEVAWVTNDPMPGEDRHYVTVFVRAEARGEPQRREPHRCRAWRFFAPGELPAPLFAPLARLVAERGAAFLTAPVAGAPPVQ
jgi:8-oxo-dGTP diphosphatase